MRTVTVILILLNGALATFGRPDEGSGERRYSCCRGTGLEAYCCVQCCLYEDCSADTHCE